MSFNPDEKFRLEQGGMGYLQFHAAVTWVRNLIKAASAPFYEYGDPGWVSPMKWEVSDTETTSFWISFEGTGHLLVSVDGGETWYGMGVTYYSPTIETWEKRVVYRVNQIRKHPGNFKAVR